MRVHWTIMKIYNSCIHLERAKEKERKRENTHLYVFVCEWWFLSQLFVDLYEQPTNKRIGINWYMEWTTGKKNTGCAQWYFFHFPCRIKNYFLFVLFRINFMREKSDWSSKHRFHDWKSWREFAHMLEFEYPIRMVIKWHWQFCAPHFCFFGYWTPCR